MPSLVRFLFYSFDEHVIDLGPKQAEKDGRFPPLHPELQESPLAVVCGEALFHSPGFEVELGILNGGEEVHVTVVIYDHGCDYQGSNSSSRDTYIRLQATRYTITRRLYSPNLVEEEFHELPLYGVLGSSRPALCGALVLVEEGVRGLLWFALLEAHCRL
jgi:hypothetical protein